MAKVKNVELCPRCHHELTGATCTNCSYNKISRDNTFFDTPNYLDMQMKDHEVSIKEAYRDPRKQEAAARLRIIEQAKWVRGCPDEIKVAALKDAHLVIQNLLHSDASTETLRAITGLGRQIGEIAAAIEGYFAKGGSRNAVLTTPRSLDSESNQEQS
jgi:hypothetical protein